MRLLQSFIIVFAFFSFRIYHRSLTKYRNPCRSNQTYPGMTSLVFDFIVSPTGFYLINETSKKKDIKTMRRFDRHYLGVS